MSVDPRLLAGIAAAAMIVWAFVNRYDVQTISGSNGNYVVVNRLTGSLEFCQGRGCYPVSHQP